MTREFQGRRLKIIGRTRDARSFTTNPMAFLDYQLAQTLSPEELSGQTTFIIVKLEPWAVRRDRPRGDPPQAAVQRRPHPRRMDVRSRGDTGSRARGWG